ncbi:unnamed protein product, partial [Choristocarpus tenellus]
MDLQQQEVEEEGRGQGQGQGREVQGVVGVGGICGEYRSCSNPVAPVFKCQESGDVIGSKGVLCGSGSCDGGGMDGRLNVSERILGFHGWEPDSLGLGTPGKAVSCADGSSSGCVKSDSRSHSKGPRARDGGSAVSAGGGTGGEAVREGGGGARKGQSGNGLHQEG